MALLNGARLCVLRKKSDDVIREVLIRTSQIKFGTEVNCTIRLKSEIAEKLHCKIFVKNEKVFIANHSSKNPISVDGKVVQKRAILSDGCLIEMCQTRFRWTFDSSLLHARTEKAKKSERTPTSSKFVKPRRTTIVRKKQLFEQAEPADGVSSRKSGPKKTQKTPTYTLPKTNKQLLKNIKKRFTMHSVMVDHNSDDDEEINDGDDDHVESATTQSNIDREVNVTPKRLATPDASKNNTPFYTPDPEKENKTPALIDKTPRNPKDLALQLENSAMMILSYTPVVGPRFKANIAKTPLSSTKKAAQSVRAGFLTPKNDNMSTVANSPNVSKVGSSMYLIDLTTPTSKNSSYVSNRSELSFSSSAGLIDLITPPSKKSKTPSSAIAKSSQKGLLRSALKNASKTPLSALRSRCATSNPKHVIKSMIDISVSKSPKTPAKTVTTPRTPAKTVRTPRTPAKTVTTPRTPASGPKNEARSQVGSPVVYKSLKSLDVSHTREPKTPQKESDTKKSAETPVMTTDELFDTLVGRQSIKKTYSRNSESPKKLPDPLDYSEGTSELPKTDVDIWVESVVAAVPSPEAVDAAETFMKMPNRTTQVRSSQYSDITPHESFTDAAGVVTTDGSQAKTLVDEGSLIITEGEVETFDKPHHHFNRRSHTPLASKIVRSLGNKRQTIGNFFTNMFGKLTVSPITRVSVTGEQSDDVTEETHEPNMNEQSEHESEISEEEYHDSESDQQVDDQTKDINPSPKLRQSLRDTRKFIGNALTSLNTSKLSLDNSGQFDESLLLNETYDNNQSELVPENYDLTDLSVRPDTQNLVVAPTLRSSTRKSTTKTVYLDYRSEISPTITDSTPVSPLVGQQQRASVFVSTPADRKNSLETLDVTISPLAVPLHVTPIHGSRKSVGNSSTIEQERSTIINNETHQSPDKTASESLRVLADTNNEISDYAASDTEVSEDECMLYSSALREPSDISNVQSPAEMTKSATPVHSRISRGASRHSAANVEAPLQEHVEKSIQEELHFSANVSSADHNINESVLGKSAECGEVETGNEELEQTIPNQSSPQCISPKNTPRNTKGTFISPSNTRSTRKSLAVSAGNSPSSSQITDEGVAEGPTVDDENAVHEIVLPTSPTRDKICFAASDNEELMEDSHVSLLTSALEQSVKEEGHHELSTMSEKVSNTQVRRGRSSLPQSQTYTGGSINDKLSVSMGKHVRNPAKSTPLIKKAIFAMCTPSRPSSNSDTPGLPTIATTTHKVTHDMISGRAEAKQETPARSTRRSRISARGLSPERSNRETTTQSTPVMLELSACCDSPITDTTQTSMPVLLTSTPASAPITHTPRTRGRASKIETPITTPVVRDHEFGISVNTPPSGKSSMVTASPGSSVEADFVTSKPEQFKASLRETRSRKSTALACQSIIIDEIVPPNESTVSEVGKIVGTISVQQSSMSPVIMGNPSTPSTEPHKPYTRGRSNGVKTPGSEQKFLPKSPASRRSEKSAKILQEQIHDTSVNQPDASIIVLEVETVSKQILVTGEHSSGDLEAVVTRDHIRRTRASLASRRSTMVVDDTTGIGSSPKQNELLSRSLPTSILTSPSMMPGGDTCARLIATSKVSTPVSVNFDYGASRKTPVTDRESNLIGHSTATSPTMVEEMSESISEETDASIEQPKLQTPLKKPLASGNSVEHEHSIESGSPVKTSESGCTVDSGADNAVDVTPSVQNSEQLFNEHLRKSVTTSSQESRTNRTPRRTLKAGTPLASPLKHGNSAETSGRLLTPSVTRSFVGSTNTTCHEEALDSFVGPLDASATEFVFCASTNETSVTSGKADDTSDEIPSSKKDRSVRVSRSSKRSTLLSDDTTSVASTTLLLSVSANESATMVEQLSESIVKNPDDSSVEADISTYFRETSVITEKDANTSKVASNPQRISSSRTSRYSKRTTIGDTSNVATSFDVTPKQTEMSGKLRKSTSDLPSKAHTLRALGSTKKTAKSAVYTPGSTASEHSASVEISDSIDRTPKVEQIPDYIVGQPESSVQQREVLTPSEESIITSENEQHVEERTPVQVEQNNITLSIQNSVELTTSNDLSQKSVASSSPVILTPPAQRRTSRVRTSMATSLSADVDRSNKSGTSPSLLVKTPSKIRTSVMTAGDSPITTTADQSSGSMASIVVESSRRSTVCADISEEIAQVSTLPSQQELLTDFNDSSKPTTQESTPTSGKLSKICTPASVVKEGIKTPTSGRKSVIANPKTSTPVESKHLQEKLHDSIGAQSDLIPEHMTFTPIKEASLIVFQTAESTPTVATPALDTIFKTPRPVRRTRTPLKIVERTPTSTAKEKQLDAVAPGTPVRGNRASRNSSSKLDTDDRSIFNTPQTEKARDDDSSNQKDEISTMEHSARFSVSMKANPTLTKDNAELKNDRTPDSRMSSSLKVGLSDSNASEANANDIASPFEIKQNNVLPEKASPDDVCPDLLKHLCERVITLEHELDTLADDSAENTSILENVQESIDETAANISDASMGIQKLLQTPTATSTIRKKLRSSTIRTDLSETKNFEGMQQLFTTPIGKMLLRSPRVVSTGTPKVTTSHRELNIVDQETPLTLPVREKKLQKQSAIDLSSNCDLTPNTTIDLEGVAQLLKTPGCSTMNKNKASNTSMQLEGVYELLKTPVLACNSDNLPQTPVAVAVATKRIEHKLTPITSDVVSSSEREKMRNSVSSLNSSSNLDGVQRLLKTPVAQASSPNDTITLEGIQQLMRTPVATSTILQSPESPGTSNSKKTKQVNNAIDDSEQLLKTPIGDRSHLNVFELFKTPIAPPNTHSKLRSSSKVIISEFDESYKSEDIQPMLQTSMTSISEASPPRTAVGDCTINFEGLEQLLKTPAATTPAVKDNIETRVKTTRKSSGSLSKVELNSTDLDTKRSLEGSLSPLKQSDATLNTTVDLEGVQQLLKTPAATTPVVKDNIKTRVKTTRKSSGSSSKVELNSTDLDAKSSLEGSLSPLKQSDATLNTTVDLEGVQQLLKTPAATTPAVKDNIETRVKTTRTSSGSSSKVELNSTDLDAKSGTLNTTVDLEGVQQLLKTPCDASVAKKVDSDKSICLESIQQLFKTPTSVAKRKGRSATSTRYNLNASHALEERPSKMAELDKSVKLDDTPLNDTIDMEGLQQLMKTPLDNDKRAGSTSTAHEDSVILDGVQQLLGAPTSRCRNESQHDNSANLEGLRTMLSTPIGLSAGKTKLESTCAADGLDQNTAHSTPNAIVMDDSVSLEGIKQLLETPVVASTGNHLLKRALINRIRGTPSKIEETRQQTTPAIISSINNQIPSEDSPNDSHLEGIQQLLQTPQTTSVKENVSSANDGSIESNTPTTSRLRRKLYTKNDPEDKTPESIKSSKVHRVTSDEYLNILDPIAAKGTKLGKKTAAKSKVPDNDKSGLDEPMRKNPPRISKKNKSLAEEALAGASPELKFVKLKQLKVVEERTPISLTEEVSSADSKHDSDIQDLCPGRRRVMFNELPQIKEINSPAIVGDIIFKVSRGRGRNAQKLVRVIVEESSDQTKIKPARRAARHDTEKDNSNNADELPNEKIVNAEITSDTAMVKRTRRGAKRVVDTVEISKDDHPESTVNSTDDRTNQESESGAISEVSETEPMVKRARRVATKSKPEPKKVSARTRSKKVDAVAEQDVEIIHSETAEQVDLLGKQKHDNATSTPIPEQKENIITITSSVELTDEVQNTPEAVSKLTESEQVVNPSGRGKRGTKKPTTKLHSAKSSKTNVSNEDSASHAHNVMETVEHTSALESFEAANTILPQAVSCAVDPLMEKAAPGRSKRATVAKSRQRRAVEAKPEMLVESLVVEQAAADSTSQGEPEQIPAKRPRGRTTRKPAMKTLEQPIAAMKEASPMPPPTVVASIATKDEVSDKLPPVRNGRKKPLSQVEQLLEVHTVEESLNESHMVKTMLPATHTSTPVMQIEENKPKATRGRARKIVNPTVAALMAEESIPNRRSPRNRQASDESRTHDSQNATDADESKTKRSRARTIAKMDLNDDSKNHLPIEENISTAIEESAEKDRSEGKRPSRAPIKRVRGKTVIAEDLAPKRIRQQPAKQKETDSDYRPTSTSANDTDEVNPETRPLRTRRGVKQQANTSPTKLTESDNNANEESINVLKSSKSRKPAAKRNTTRKKTSHVEEKPEDNDASIAKEIQKDDEPTAESVENVTATTSRRRPLRSRK